MKCEQFESTGEPGQVLQCVQRDRPSPQHGEVLVRMLASPVNPSDLMFIRGVYGLEPHLPQSPGFEGVGVVEASGGGLRGKLFRGKRVAVLNRAGGNWSEYTV
ncbi:MAG: alcohol dehydrogenase catalytic domain-containing protein, partial [Fuerstiella sp.]|nr:alcohol dehydrogenase catalytic domain-containing protein [Fuerstiella sp.]